MQLNLHAAPRAGRNSHSGDGEIIFGKRILTKRIVTKPLESNRRQAELLVEEKKQKFSRPLSCQQEVARVKGKKKSKKPSENRNKKKQ